MIAFLLLAEAATATVPMPAFLAGCWEEKRAEQSWTEECWTDPRGGLMIGSGRNGKADHVANWEWMRIERGADGAVTFYGSPKGAPAVGFKATEADAKSITFVNVSHDYPQRVRYVLTETGLDAQVSLNDGSKPNRWSYRRTAGTPQK
jgi:ABC-type sugar transport system substrate-binding protein